MAVMIRGRSIKSIMNDVAEGFLSVTPLFLKPLKPEEIKELYLGIQKMQKDIRGVFPSHDLPGIRQRNLKLQRLNNAGVVVKHYALSKRMTII